MEKLIETQQAITAIESARAELKKAMVDLVNLQKKMAEEDLPNPITIIFALETANVALFNAQSKLADADNHIKAIATNDQA